MTIKSIPARKIVICDGCGAEGEHGRDPFRKNGRLTMSRNALDHLTEAVADGTYAIDLCDHCERTFSATINETLKLVRRPETEDSHNDKGGS